MLDAINTVANVGTFLLLLGVLRYLRNEQRNAFTFRRRQNVLGQDRIKAELLQSPELLADVLRERAGLLSGVVAVAGSGDESATDGEES